MVEYRNVMGIHSHKVPNYLCWFCLTAILSLAACARKINVTTQTGVENTGQERPNYNAIFHTSKGYIVIEVHKSWAPNSANRFLDLIASGYFNGCKFYRVLKGFMAQSGINGDPKTTALWKMQTIDDDPPLIENVRGTVCMARSGAPNSATAQFLINVGDNTFLKSQGYAPFGRVSDGMDVVDQLYSGYGEGAPMGSGPIQHRVIEDGDAYLASEFPLLDFIINANLQ
jgi:peptidyl-prolyl cis-trans isomerase A (cyclophilin A)